MKFAHHYIEMLIKLYYHTEYISVM